jgi:hypothetical protein
MSRLQSPSHDTFPSADAALDAMDARSLTVEASLEALRLDSAPLRKGATSILADLRRCRQNRLAVRRLLGLLPVAPSPSAPKSTSLRDLRAAEQDLVFAHAEGIPVLGNPRAVSLLVPDLLDVARHLALVDLWLEEEDK